MASEQIDQKIFQRTRDTLGKVIKKPPLQDKLLTRPPFKFLRDIILAVFRETEFFKGLYSDKELDTKSEWDRELKTSFLQKAIDVVALTTKKAVKARPPKILSGAEADKTNEFLQLLGIAILKKLDSSEAIEKVLRGEKSSQAADKSKHKDPKKHHEEKKPIEAEKTSDPSKEEEKENVVVPATETPPVERPQNRPSTRRKTRETPKKSSTDETSNQVDEVLASDGSGSQVKLHERPTSAKGGRKSLNDIHSTSSSLLDNKGLDENSQIIDQQPLTLPSSTNAGVSNGGSGLVSVVNTRPSSARPPAPRVVSRVVDEDESQSRLSSGHDRVPPNVILDKEDDKGDDDEFVVQSASVSTGLNQSVAETTGQSTEDTKPEGALAKTLLETKEKFVGEGDISRGSSTKDITIDEAQRKRERETVQKEVKTLQGSIQSLCQSANPLGKMMDYVQEDLDSMYQELELWKRENASHTEALHREEKITEEELNPLQSQLAELEERVTEQLDLIANMKVNIMKNEVQMKNLITSNH